MKFNLANYPKCCLHQGRQDERELYRCKTLAHIEGMKAELREIDQITWFEENVYEDWTWEGMLKKFIEKEILGE